MPDDPPAQESDSSTPLSSFFGLRIHWKSIVIILAAVTCVYVQTLRFGFVNYDDDELVYRNGAFLSQWSHVGTAFVTDAFVGVGGGSVYYRPLLMVSYIADYHVWHFSAGGYHFTNILLHALTSVGVFVLALLIVKTEILALFAGLIFALHPVQTESVAWIAGRNDVLLGLLIVAMMICFVASFTLPHHSKVLRRASGLFFLLALLTKESAAFYLLLFPAYEWSVQDLQIRETGLGGILKKYAMFGIILVGYLFLRLAIFGTVIGAEHLYGHRSMVDRLENLPAIFSEQCQLLVAPLQLSVAHPLDDLYWFRSPWNIAALLIVAAVLLGIFLLRKIERRPWFGLAWVLTGLLPLLGIIPVAIPIFEHRLYVPMVGFALMLAALGSMLRQNFSMRAVQGGMLIIVIILAVMSFVRLPVWRSGITLFSDAVEKAPTYSPSYFSLAGAYYEAGTYSEAVRWIEGYLTRVPGDERALSLLRDSYYLNRQFDQAESVSQAMTRLEPRTSRRYAEAGTFAEKFGQLDTAVSDYHSAIGLDSSAIEAYIRLGMISEALHKSEDAMSYYRAVLLRSPADTTAATALAELYSATGKGPDAIRLLEQCLDKGMFTHEMIELLKKLYLQSGDLLKADQLSKRFP